MATETIFLEIQRTFQAPLDLVWKAWTDPELLIKWSCPKDFKVLYCEGNLQVGETWRSGMQAPWGEKFLLRGEYREITPQTKLVQTHVWVDPENPEMDAGPETLVTVNLDEQDGKTHMHFLQEGFSSLESKEGHLSGWNETFDNLSKFLGGA